jgi:hypothetical protein
MWCQCSVDYQIPFDRFDQKIQTSTSGGGPCKEREKLERIFRLKIAEDLLFMDLVDRTTEPPHSTEIYKKRLAIAKRRFEQNEGGNEQSEEAPAISGTRASIRSRRRQWQGARWGRVVEFSTAHWRMHFPFCKSFTTFIPNLTVGL